MGTRLPASVVLLACLSLATRAWGLDFAPCTETDHQQFECATLTVPLDRAGVVPGTIDLAIERLPSTTPDLPILIALAGGPGQSATAFASTFASVFAAALHDHQLVVFDQRGTGRSGVLDCPDLRAHFNADTLTACATALGSAARFYTTADSVLDLEDIRAALGVAQMTIAGVSYGTWVAAQYARTFPAQTTALVLDSTVPPDDVNGLAVESVSAIPRVIGEICRDGACPFTAHPVPDTTALVRRLAKPLRGIVIDGSGHRMRRAITPPELFAILEAGDLDQLLQARYPGAIVAAMHRDVTPLLRLAELTSLSESGVVRRADPAVRENSVTLQVATACADVRFPWQESDPLATRSAALDAARAALPPLVPFDATIAVQSSYAPSCLYWPTTSLARATSAAPLPDVPALILTGTRDVRTPLENADAVAALLPHAVRVVVPNRGHSLLTGDQCARDAATAFLSAMPVGDPCATLTPRFATEAPPPKSLRGVDARGLPGTPGRVVSTTIDTLNDAIDSALTVYHGPGRPISVGGLRAGHMEGTIDAQSLHLTLVRFTLVRGVAVSGTIEADANGTRADTTVRGRLGGTLTFGVDGSIQGRLGRRVVSLIPRAAAGGGVLRVGLPGLRPIR